MRVSLSDTRPRQTRTQKGQHGAGSDATQLCSVLLKNGPDYLATIKNELVDWLEQNELTSIAELKGQWSQKRCANPGIFERSNYINLLDSFSRADGVRA